MCRARLTPLTPTIQIVAYLMELGTRTACPLACHYYIQTMTTTMTCNCVRAHLVHCTHKKKTTTRPGTRIESRVIKNRFSNIRDAISHPSIAHSFPFHRSVPFSSIQPLAGRLHWREGCCVRLLCNGTCMPCGSHTQFAGARRVNNKTKQIRKSNKQKQKKKEKKKTKRENV